MTTWYGTPLNRVIGKDSSGNGHLNGVLRMEKEPSRKTTQGNFSKIRNSKSNSQAEFSVLKELSESHMA